MQIQNVLFNIKGSQMQNPEEKQDEINLTTYGTLAHEDGKYTLAYNDTEGTSNQNTVTEIKVDGNSVIMQKTGGFETQFIFEQSKLYSTVFRTPFGNMSMSVFPTLVDTHLGNDRGSIDLEYIINVAGAQFINKLSLSYQTEKTRQA